MERAKRLINKLLTVSDTGLDSYEDNKPERLAKFALVCAALDYEIKNGESQQINNAVKAHLTRLKESVRGALD
jgi:hypothetical protein